jgi:uncharacterized protein with LGFP repeats
LINFETRGNAGNEGYEGLSVRFSGGEIAQHKLLIVPDGVAKRGVSASVHVVS